MTVRVGYSPRALSQLEALYGYIATTASPSIAAGYTTAILDYCDTLKTFPQRGARRDDIRPGLRITHYRGRSIIAFTVEGESVIVLGVFYGGQDYAAALHDRDE